MRIAIVNDYLSQGGAAIACHRLAVALAASGATIRRFALQRGRRPPTDGAVDFAPEPFGRRTAALIDSVAALGCEQGAETWRLHEAEKRLARSVAEWHPEIVNVHNLHGFSTRFHTAAILAELGPLVWTLHDMWSFTGRCAYSFDCRLFEAGCTAACPTPQEYPALEPQFIAGAWKRRADFFSAKQRLAAVTPSQWLAAEARRGLWQGHTVEAIPNSLDLEVLAPIDRATSRTALGLPPSQLPSVLIAAEYLNERRKGGDLIRSVLAACGKEIEVLTLGHGAPNNLPGNAHHRPLGYIDHERMKALVFSAADCLLHPARTDNYPNTVAESLACGTPVVAFRVGGIPEMLPAAECGLLAEPGDADSLGRAICETLTKTPLRFEERLAIRAAVTPLFDPMRQAAAYLELFRKVSGAAT